MPLPLIKFTRGVPPPETFPTAHLSECASTVLERDGEVILQYGSAGGFPPLRAWIAEQSNIDTERVLIGQGSLQLVDLISRVLLKPGDLVYIENPSYDFSVEIFRRTGAHVTGIPLAGDGPDIDQVQSRLEAGERPVLFYVIPDFQNPSGSVISSEKRHQLAVLAEKYNFWIIEDIPYRRLRYHGTDLPTLLSLAPDQTMQLSSYSKLISPGLRVGYAILPAVLAPRLIDFASHTYINPSYINQAVVYEYIQRGFLEMAVPRLITLYRSHLDAMLDSLEQHMARLCSYHCPEGGFFVGLYLNHGFDVPTLQTSAGRHGLQLTDGRNFFAEPVQKTFIRLPFSALGPEDIKTGVARLADVIQEVTLASEYSVRPVAN